MTKRKTVKKISGHDRARPESAYARGQREYRDDQHRRQDALRAASVFHVNVGGIGNLPPMVEADNSLVTLTSKRGASIQINWDDHTGGFQIHAGTGEDMTDRGNSTTLSIRPVSSNTAVVVVVPHDFAADAERVRRREVADVSEDG